MEEVKVGHRSLEGLVEPRKSKKSILFKILIVLIILVSALIFAVLAGIFAFSLFGENVDDKGDGSGGDGSGVGDGGGDGDGSSGSGDDGGGDGSDDGRGDGSSGSDDEVVVGDLKEGLKDCLEKQIYNEECDNMFKDSEAGDKCEELGDLRNTCFYQLGLVNLDESYCDKIDNVGLKDNCKMELEVFSGDLG